MTDDRRIPLAVDMDGTLVLSDTLHESLLALLRLNPLYLFAMPLWLLGGKARFKREIASRVVPDACSLPYNEALLSWLDEQKQDRKIILCTAADRAIADAVAARLGLFDEVFASDGDRNLAGRNKADVLVEHFGERGFDYAANGRIDLATWSVARQAVVVNATPAVERAAHAIGRVERVFPAPRTGIGAWARAFRLHQWVKNLLIFVPLLTAHLAFDVDAIGRALVAFFAFGLCASSVYLLNDLLDLPADRSHPRKRHRPFASGQLPLLTGLTFAPILLVAAFFVAWTLPDRFMWTLAAYYLLTLAYSLKLKRVETLDVISLASLYTARIIAGTFAMALPLSFWLLAFSMFLFLSLALVKRYTELALMRDSGRDSAAGRGYRVADLPLLGSLGGSAGYLSVLVLALYINSQESAELYSRPKTLWLLCPLLLYWISRTWMLTHRGLMHDDPLLFAIRDRVSLLVLTLGFLTVGLSI